MKEPGAGIGILSTGSYLPGQVIDNELIAAWTGMSPRATLSLTGIVERRYAPDGMCTSQIAEPAARAALDACGSSQMGVIVVGTSTPDRITPATAAILQHRLGLSGVPAFDVNAACSGFVYALAAGRGMLYAEPGLGRALVVGVDLPSRYVNRADRRTACLFGDAAGAVVLGPVPPGYGIRAVALITHGEWHDGVMIPAGGTAEPLTPEATAAGRQWLTLDGRHVRDYVLDTVPKVVQTVLDRSGWDTAEIGRFIFHQANARLLAELAEVIGIDPERVPMTAPAIGSTGAASVPVTLDMAHKSRPIQRSEKVILAAVGGGAAAGAVALRWY